MPPDRRCPIEVTHTSFSGRVRQSLTLPLEPQKNCARRARGNARPASRDEAVRADGLQQVLAAPAVLGHRSELWCNSTDEERSPHSQKLSTPDQFQSIDDHSATFGRSLLAKFGFKWLYHDAAGRTAANAGSGALRSIDSNSGVSVLRRADPRNCTIAAGPREPRCGAARPAL